MRVELVLSIRYVHTCLIRIPRHLQPPLLHVLYVNWTDSIAVLDSLPLAVVEESLTGVASTWNYQKMRRTNPGLFPRLIEACELSVRVDDRLQLFLLDLLQF